MRDNPTIGIVGGGAWGTALAIVLARFGLRRFQHPLDHRYTHGDAGRVTVFARDAAAVTSMNERRENPRLPGVKLDARITATSDVLAIVASDILLLAVPAQTLRATLGAFAPHLTAGTPVVICAKGLEHDTGKRLSEVVAEIAPQTVPAVLSGPSFAADVARGLPTAVTIASHDEAIALDLCRILAGPTFRPYAETDVVGVEIGGAVKNVPPLAAGIVSGRKLGASALAALTARGFAELRRLGEAMGARPDTLMGLSGLGDLVLTCSGPQSRNFAYGQMLGAGGDPTAAHPLVEGIATAAVARALARSKAVPMPIVEAVAAILDGTLAIDAAVEALMTRPLKREAD